MKQSVINETIAELWSSASRQFTEAGFESPDLEARALLAGLLRCSLSSVILRSEDALDEAEIAEFKSHVERRLKHEPAAYINKIKNFMGFDFEVDPNVLIPRPETELLVDDLLMEIRDGGLAAPRILDVGTGSGCIAVSLAKSHPSAEIMACDVSQSALTLAAKNAEKMDAKVEFLLSDLFKGLPAMWKGGFDMIVSNPPYIVSSVLPRLQPEISYEPRLALDGGVDGLASLRPLVQQALFFLRPQGLLALEIGHDQGEVVRRLFEDSGYEKVTILKDYSGFERIAKGRKRGSV